MRNKFLSLVIWAVLALSLAAQVDFYVDSNTTVPTAEQNGSKLKPYDHPTDVAAFLSDETYQRIFFARGSVFSLTKSVTYTSNIYLGVYGSGAKPIFDGSGGTAISAFRWEYNNCHNVTVENLVARRCTSHGFLFQGAVSKVFIYKCEAREIVGFNGFVHESSTTGSNVEASGRIVYRECIADKINGDGFSNRGRAKALISGCSASFCGPMWGTWESSKPVTPLVGTTTERPRTRNIYADSVNGADSNDGLSPAFPKQTITGVETILSTGDVLHLARNSTFTVQLDPVNGNTIVPYGYGAPPRFNMSGSGNAIVVTGVSDLHVEGVTFEDCSNGVISSGTALNMSLSGCLFYNCGDGIDFANNDTFGAWTVYDCDFAIISLRGIIAGGGSTLSAIDCRFYDCDASSGSAIRFEDSATGSVLGGRFEMCRIGIEVTTDTGPHVISGCHFYGDGSANSTTMRGIDLDLNGTPDATNPPKAAIINSIFHGIDPGASDNIFLVQTDVETEIYGCTFYDENAGTNSRTTVGVDVQGNGSLTLRNSLFDGYAHSASYFVRTASGSFGEMTAATNNYFFDPGGAPSKWFSSSAQSFATWGGVSGITDGTTGSYNTGALLTDVPDEYFDDAVLSGSYGTSTAEDGGADLSSLVATYPTLAHDFGFRTRGLDGTWAVGALESTMTSPDGYTTHNTSGMEIRDSSASVCEDGIHMTHSQSNPTSDDMSIVNFTATKCYRFGINSSAPGVFLTEGIVFNECDSAANGPDGASGETQMWDRIVIKMSPWSTFGLNVATNTAVLSNAIVVFPEWSRETDLYGIRNSGPLAVYNSSFVFATLASETTNFFGAYATTGGISASNNVFEGSDCATNYYLRVTSAAGMGVVDNNYYRQTTSDNDNYYIDNTTPPNTFTEWQATNKGTGAQATDADGARSTESVMNLTQPDDRLLKPTLYGAAEYGLGWRGGSNQNAAFRTDYDGAIRSSTELWNAGPFALSRGAQGIYRRGKRMIFSKFTLTSNTGTSLRIADRAVSSGEKVRVTIDGAGFGSLSVIAFRIHEGPETEDRPVFAGILSINMLSGLTIEGDPGQDLFLTFDSTSGSVYGNISWDIVAASSNESKTKVEKAGVK